jgi:hypothetical protein
MRLLVDLVWTRPDGTEYVIPAGSITDGPSIPLWLQPFLPDRGETFEAGALHDYLCSDPEIPLSWADAEFRQALRACGVSAIYAYVCYVGLRLAAPWRSGTAYFALPFVHSTSH